MKTEIELVQSVMLPVSKLEPNTGQIKGVPSDPRKMSSSQFERLCESIKNDIGTLSLHELIVVKYKKKYVVVSGVHQLRASKKLGIKEVPCKVIPDNADASMIRAYIIKFHLSYGDWDDDALMKDWTQEELNFFGLDIEFGDEETVQETSGATDLASQIENREYSPKDVSRFFSSVEPKSNNQGNSVVIKILVDDEDYDALLNMLARELTVFQNVKVQ